MLEPCGHNSLLTDIYCLKVNNFFGGGELISLQVQLSAAMASYIDKVSTVEVESKNLILNTFKET